MPSSTPTGSSNAPTPSLGLPRSARLRRRQDFRRVYGRGRRIRGKLLIVVALRRREAGHRLGLSVSKDHGRAVRRNKIKRILREAFRLTRPCLPGQYDVILIPQKSAAKLRLAHVREELEHLLQQLQAGKGRPRRP
jgi:ribonuclease P protein component